MEKTVHERQRPRAQSGATPFRARTGKSFRKPDGDELVVLDNVNLTLRPGEIVGLLGRSGSGKSTLLRLIAGLDAPTGGEVDYLGAPVAGPADGIAMVFQSFALFPWLTVLENVQLGLEALRLPGGGDAQALAAGDRPHRSRRLRVRVSARALRRHAPACRVRPGAGGPSQHPADGRAVLRARCADRRDAAQRLPRPLGRGAAAHQVGAARHSQHRGGGADVRPPADLLDPSGAGGERDPDRSAASALAARSALPRARGARVCRDDRRARAARRASGPRPSVSPAPASARPSPTFPPTCCRA